jgi:hypothetical protein
MRDKAFSLQLVLRKGGISCTPATALRPPYPPDISSEIPTPRVVLHEATRAPARPPDPLPPSEGVFLDGHALLVYSPLLGFSLWLVRDRHAGRALSRETGHPSLLPDDALSQLGRTPDEVRRALLPALIAAAE